MKHVKRLSNESIPASAIIIVDVETKAECKDVVPSAQQSACKETVKDGRIYSLVID